jgi:hypothetical protein
VADGILEGTAMSGAGLALQGALYDALTGDVALSGLVEGVFDGPAAGAALPYVTIGPDLVTDRSTKTGTLREHRYAVTVWAAGESVAAVKPAMAAIEAAVLGMAPALEGWRLVRNDFLRCFVRRDVRAGLVSGTVEFRALIEAE